MTSRPTPSPTRKRGSSAPPRSRAPGGSGKAGGPRRGSSYAACCERETRGAKGAKGKDTVIHPIHSASSCFFLKGQLLVTACNTFYSYQVSAHGGAVVAHSPVLTPIGRLGTSVPNLIRKMPGNDCLAHLELHTLDQITEQEESGTHFLTSCCDQGVKATHDYTSLANYTSRRLEAEAEPKGEGQKGRILADKINIPIYTSENLS
ncbi:uncharacterized protein [Vicugna pacos]|uniref:Uncharacterized protein n=1 Tax=Vicugna pacos TaxID=30538 RepID=A0A6J0AEW0_VICPA|nr:uncharacterized protein LOC107033235 [Vicugna pacos]